MIVITFCPSSGWREMCPLPCVSSTRIAFPPEGVSLSIARFKFYARAENRFRSPLRQNRRRARSVGNGAFVRKLSNEIANSEGTMFRPFNLRPAPWFVTSRTQHGWTRLILTHEEHQYIAIDHRAASGAPLVTWRLKHFPKRLHARLPHGETKPPDGA
jgi:hypothetical protein